ncbi:hypothetical protein IE53DRAFT_384530 [Violaceomyces palustris]|uniref:Uncharacterized protein n=1 Tax=Violaceomyces palustris TaxID=1673888 RepID=A0ACD0P4S8_9BASI|nr:hypothetical protein IE53DRAFT_384530 [Violaceomyces palustris]
MSLFLSLSLSPSPSLSLSLFLLAPPQPTSVQATSSFSSRKEMCQPREKTGVRDHIVSSSRVIKVLSRLGMEECIL